MNKNSDGRYLISVVKKLKLLDGKWEELYSNDENNSFLECFATKLSKKKYLFYWSKETPLNQLNVVDQIMDNLTDINFKPQDAYLIIFTKITNSEESEFKEVISVEENEFRYKKYVCYYTDEELADLKQHEDQLLSDNDWSKGTTFDDTKKYKSLLYRIIIKVPIIQLVFEKKELEEFEDIFEEEKRNSKNFSFEELTKMENHIDQELEIGKTEEEFVNSMMKIIYGDDVFEYLS